MTCPVAPGAALTGRRFESSIQHQWRSKAKGEFFSTMAIDWNDAEEIGIQLCEKFPEIRPLDARFTDLHRWVCELEEFEGDPAKSNEKILEAIQMAWYEEWKAERGED